MCSVLSCYSVVVQFKLWSKDTRTGTHSMQEDSSRSPSYTVACEDYVHVVEFSPFSSGTPASLLAYGGNQYVVVGTCLFQVRDAASYNLVHVLHSILFPL